MRKVAILFAVYYLLQIPAHLAGQPLVKSSHKAYDSYYDLSTLNPAVVVWHLDFEDFKGNLKPSTRRFKADTQLPPPRVKDKDLKGSGYVRGHLCPAGDRDTDKGLLKETYLTSNMAPMTMVCNSGPWKIVEDSCRILAKRHGKLIVAAGTIFLDDSLGVHKVNGISVPAAFFRIARCTTHPEHIWIWLVQNSWGESKPVRIGTKELEQVIQHRAAIISVLKYHGLID